MNAQSTLVEGALACTSVGSGIGSRGLVMTPATVVDPGVGVGSVLGVGVDVVAATGGGSLRAWRASKSTPTVPNTRATDATRANAGKSLEAGLPSATRVDASRA